MGGGNGILGRIQIPNIILATHSCHFQGKRILLMLKKQPKSIFEKSVSGAKHTGPAMHFQARYGWMILSPLLSV